MKQIMTNKTKQFLFKMRQSNFYCALIPFLGFAKLRKQLDL